MYLLIGFLPVFILTLCLSGCGARYTLPQRAIKKAPTTQRPYRINGHVYFPLPSAQGFVEKGYASWYGKKFHGRPTASGEPYNMYAMTAAHRILPVNTYVRVLNLENGREAVVRISDRGPFVKSRIIDLSYGAARKLGMIGSGVARVRIEALGEVQPRSGPPKFKPHPNFKKGRFYVQVGAFLRPENAYTLRRRMTRYYKGVVVSRQPKGARTFYRVQIFAATNYDRARSFEARIERLGFPNAFVVAR